MDARAPAPLGGVEVKTAALVVPSLSAPMSVTTPIPAVAVAPAPAGAAPTRMAEAASTRPMRAAVIKAAFHPDPQSAAIARPATSLRAKPEVAMLDHKLLSDSTLGDLLARARTEKGRGR